MKIIAHTKIWFAISALLILGSISAIGYWGINFGIDFTGGSLLEVSIQGERPTAKEIRETLDPLLERDFVAQISESGIILRAESLTEEAHAAIVSALMEKFGPMDELRFESIGPVLGSELAVKTGWALGIVFAAIIIYVAWSFRRMSDVIPSWKAGIITIFTGIHDVLIPLGIFAALGNFYEKEVSAAFAAAVLTILGYSINDTIVIFDRIRENLTKFFQGKFEEVVEAGVRQSISRSINTTLTTLLALLAVYFFGGSTLRDFVLVLVLGIGIGAYSSIFVASPLLVAWHKHRS